MLTATPPEITKSFADSVSKDKIISIARSVSSLSLVTDVLDIVQYTLQ